MNGSKLLVALEIVEDQAPETTEAGIRILSCVISLWASLLDFLDKTSGAGHCKPLLTTMAIAALMALDVGRGVAFQLAKMFAKNNCIRGRNGRCWGLFHAFRFIFYDVANQICLFIISLYFCQSLFENHW